MELNELFSIKIAKPDENVRNLAKEKWDALAKPIDGMGTFEDVICKIAGIRGTANFDLKKKALIIMCADNGIVKEGVSQTGKEVTFEVASLMGVRKSSVGIMLKNYPAEIITIDVGIDRDETPAGVINRKVRRGTGDFIHEPAMSPEETLKAICVGIDVVKECRKKGVSILATGEMGIGNTTTSSALMSVITGLDVRECTGRGAGLSDEGLNHKIKVIKEGIRFHFGERNVITKKEDVFNALRKLGGLDIAGLCGIFIGGAIYKIPVVVDGFISIVSALIAERIVPGCRDYMIASHLGKEKGMSILSAELGLVPVINGNMALGEGTGAVMLFPLLDMAISLYESGTFFEDTPIKKYERFDSK